MADSAPPPQQVLEKQLSVPVHQAGGGLPSFEDVKVKQFQPQVLPYLQKIFEKQAGAAGKKWSKDAIIEFLHHVQADRVTDPSGDMAGQDELEFDGFLRYMGSSAANVHGPLPEADLSWPISSYYISSSHNTYLTGNQLSSESDADAYKTVLLRGCRCVEVDVWDGDDSDSEFSSSSDEESKEKRELRKANRKEKVASRLPDSLTSRLEKTSIGRRLTSKLKSTDDSKTATADATSTTSSESPTSPPLKKVSSPTGSIIEPRVLHGWTLTKEVPFRHVCQAIKDNAFTVTDLPLIVSLEVHCNHQQQQIMVEIMQEIFAGLLVESPTDDPAGMPPPGDLRGKILVKVKYTAPGKKEKAADSSDRLPADAENPEVAKKAAKPPKIIEALSSLGVFTRGVSFKSLTQPEAKMPTHIFSLSEGTVADVHEESAQELFEHNRHYMMRTYPSGTRITSSNLDPQVFWRKGIQIVALNWQKWDEGMMLNEGMFAGTGGFVLKPVGYRGRKPVEAPAKATAAVGVDASSTNETTSAAATTAPAAADAPAAAAPAAPVSLPLGSEPAISHQTVDLKITVFAAQNLPLPHSDDKVSGFRPYLKVELHTAPPHTLLKQESAKAKEGEYKARTKVNKEGTVHPDFKGEVLSVAEEVTCVVPELAFVRFLVKDDEIGRDDLAAWACVRLDRLKSGYRWVHLFSKHGRVSGGAVLVFVEKKLS